MNCNYQILNQSVVASDACYVFDENGKRYVDFGVVVWCVALGHNNKQINEAIIRQMGIISHTGYRYTTKIVDEAAGKVLDLLNFKDGKCVFLSSGSEAVEFGVKVAKTIVDMNTAMPYFLCLSDYFLSSYGISAERSKDASSEKNRAQNCLTVSNNMLSSVVSDTFGKSARSIITKLLENPEDIGFDVAPLMKKNMKSTPDEVSRAIQGNIDPAQAVKLQVCLDHLDGIATHKSSLEEKVMELANPYQKQIEQLLTLPGISDPLTAIAIIGEIGVDMSAFLSVRHFCSWAGVVPANNESAGKKKSVRCARAGVYIKPLMVQIAHAAVKSKKCPYFSVRYNQIARRRGKKKAIIAIAHMLLVCIFHMFARSENFKPELYTLPENQKPTAKQKLTAKQARKLLESLGATVVMPEDIPIAVSG